MKLNSSIDNLAKRLERLEPQFSSSNKTGLKYWKDKPKIPLDEWIRFRGTLYTLDYFPDDFHQVLTYIPENENKSKKGKEREDVKKWNSDFIELIEYTRNSNYGKMKCFHCLLSQDGDDPIFIGINRLVTKGLANDEQDPIQYPCQVVNRFRCPYERTNTKRAMNFVFDIEELFKLEKMAFAVEISLAKARKEDSRIRIRNKRELLQALTDKNILAKILEQGTEAPEVSENTKTYLAENQDNILNYFMKIKNKVNLEELQFY